MYIDKKKVDKVKFFSIIKFILAIVCGFPFFIATVLFFAGDVEMMEFWYIIFVFDIPFVFLIYSAVKNINLSKKAVFYNSIFILDSDGYVYVSELSKKMNLLQEKVIKDIKKLMGMNILKNISLDLEQEPKVILMNTNKIQQIQYKELICPYCGAKVKKREGFSSKCEYCDSQIS